MIHHISGTVTDVTENGVVVEAAGIGFFILCSGNTLALLKKGTKATVRTFLHADQHELYGFANGEELLFFEQLLSISGIGPKSALKLLNAFAVRDLKSIIVLERADALSKRGGVGKKTAQRIIVELKDKLQKEQGGDTRVVSLDVEEVLKTLGYNKSDIAYAFSHISEKATTEQQQIKEALASLAKRNGALE
jgi:Holliday junction DNA helicase RuvA